MTGTKLQRQRAVLELVRREPLGSQDEIRRRLADLGLPATQSTISRDLEELGLVRVRGTGGELHYATPEETRPASPGNGLRALLREFAAGVDHSGNLVLVTTPPGAAMAVARVIDESSVPGVLGTVAGDDTIIVVTRRQVRAVDVARRLREIAGLA